MLLAENAADEALPANCAIWPKSAFLGSDGGDDGAATAAASMVAAAAGFWFSFYK